jgi:hypothetical protein
MADILGFIELPAGVLFAIANSLDLQDKLHLMQTCRDMAKLVMCCQAKDGHASRVTCHVGQHTSWVGLKQVCQGPIQRCGTEANRRHEPLSQLDGNDASQVLSWMPNVHHLHIEQEAEQEEPPSKHDVKAIDVLVGTAPKPLVNRLGPAFESIQAVTLQVGQYLVVCTCTFFIGTLTTVISLCACF